jgi:hypothetical protein
LLISVGSHEHEKSLFYLLVPLTRSSFLCLANFIIFRYHRLFVNLFGGQIIVHVMQVLGRKDKGYFLSHDYAVTICIFGNNIATYGISLFL